MIKINILDENVMVIHGSTRSKKLVYLLDKFGIGLSYTDVLLLEAAWEVSELREVFH